MGGTEDRSGALADRLVSSAIGALELYTVYLGNELGLYATLERDGPLTAAELAERAGIAPRYAQEWLEQQAVAGLIDVEPGDLRRFRLSDDQARALMRVDDELHVAPLAHILVGIGGVLPEVAAAYRAGDGVPFAAYGAALRHGQGHMNRPVFTTDLPTTWLTAMPDVMARLQAADRPRIVDIACGQGWSTIAVAKAFPQAEVLGIDLDTDSVADARRHAAEAGLGERVRFLESDASSLDGRYDFALLLEALHDMARPVEVLRAARAALAADGVLLLVDERVADEFTAPGNEVERMMYGWSVTHCLPASMVEQPSDAIGTVIRAGTVRRLAAEAGYSGVEVLPVENDFFRLYRLDR